MRKTCRVADCPRRGITRGFCQLHYDRWRRGSDLAAPPSVNRGPEARRRRALAAMADCGLTLVDGVAHRLLTLADAQELTRRRERYPREGRDVQARSQATRAAAE